MGDILVHWSARAAVACYGARFLVDAPRRSGSGDGLRREQAARWLWTAGCGVYLLHVLAAFHFVHGWSHAAAIEHTARRAAQTVGWEWGGGIWVNHLFAAVWAADVAGWWIRGRGPRPPGEPGSPAGRGLRAWDRFAHAFLAFIVINATVVFGPWWWKPLAAAYLLLRLVVFLRGRVNPRPG